jgi:hypothetical protein
MDLSQPGAPVVKSKALVKRFSVILSGIFLAVAAVAVEAQGRTLVFINGYELSAQELYVAQQQLGARIAPGNYLYDGQSGCWMELNSGRSGCPASAGAGNGTGGSYISPYGSGEWNANGDWNHWSNAAGGAVGGTGDGCIYTSFGWSNC